jgi:hypothetical protein
MQIKKWTYPYKLYAYDERGVNIHTIFKIKDLSDEHSKGINPMNIHQKDLIFLAKRLGLKVNPADKKLFIVNKMKSFILNTESKYRAENNTKKIFYYSYETIVETN